jgi:ribose 5-phosphate isomerase B
MEKIGIACDHAGYEMKEFLVGYLGALGYEVLDFGTHSPESVDFPDYAHPLAEAIEQGEIARGVGLCGSGEGMAMTLNKHRGIRAGLAWEPEIAELIRRHNDANVIVFPARFITNDEAAAMLDIFLATEFEGGRHERRIAKIPAGCA